MRAALLVLAILSWSCACAPRVAPAPPAPGAAARCHDEVPVGGYLGSDDTTGERIRELLRAEGIESIAYGSLGYTVSVCADQAERARVLLGAAIEREGLRASVVP